MGPTCWSFVSFGRKKMKVFALLNRSSQPRAVVARIGLYVIATVGPIGASIAQFLLSIHVLSTSSPIQFGTFSFLLVTSQFGAGIWSALFCAPLPVIFSGHDETARRAEIRSLFAVNGLLAVVSFFVYWALSAWLDATPSECIIFSCYGGISLLRWFARSHAYAVGAAWQTVTSDLVYVVCLLFGISLLMLRGSKSLDGPFLALCIGSVCSLIPFGSTHLIKQFVNISLGDIAHYRRIWLQHSRWALTGVAMGEATANAHAYFVTVFASPAAFAPLAASALFIRPIGVVMNALTEFERPRIAKLIDAEELVPIFRSLKLFKIVLVTGWLATVMTAILIAVYAPRLLNASKYDPNYMAVGIALWMAIAGARLSRTPQSTLLQAAGLFKPLAFASVHSAGFSIVLAALLLAFGGPLWSLAGVLVGEIVFAMSVWRRTHSWFAANEPRPVVASPSHVAQN